ncbi:osteopontin [Cavia porcellus]|uniref:osteopontin n=1 Tax=Cavia porcellus TaxID=10141 RepID=UPI002FE1F4DD
MRVTVICFCLLGIASSFPVKQADSGSSEEKLHDNKLPEAASSWLKSDPSQKQNLLAPQNAMSSEETNDLKQETLPSTSNESHDHMDDLDDEDDGDLDTDDPNDEDDAHHSNESDHSDESDEVVTEAPTNGPETPIFSPIVPTIETFDGRGDSLAYGLRSRSKKLHVSDSQFSDVTDEDLTSHVKSQESHEAHQAVLLAQHLNVPSDWDSHGKDSHESSQLDDLSVETHSQEHPREHTRKARDHSSEHSDAVDSREGARASPALRSQEHHSQELRSQEHHSQELRSQELRSQEHHSQELHSPELHSPELHSVEDPKSKEEDEHLKIRISHELDSASSEAN